MGKSWRIVYRTPYGTDMNHECSSDTIDANVMVLEGFGNRIIAVYQIEEGGE